MVMPVFVESDIDIWSLKKNSSAGRSTSIHWSRTGYSSPQGVLPQLDAPESVRGGGGDGQRTDSA